MTHEEQIDDIVLRHIAAPRTISEISGRTRLAVNLVEASIQRLHLAKRVYLSTPRGRGLRKSPTWRRGQHPRERLAAIMEAAR